MEEERLAAHLRDRPEELREARRAGARIVGYFPGNYVPEEIIHASGAVPICLAHGGSPRPAEAGLSMVPNIICPFARTQIGERLLKDNPYYSMIDMLVAPITCQHLRKVTEIWEWQGDLEIFKLGIPHQYDGDFELKYYADRLRALRDRLQAFTGNEITDEKIKESINLYNRMRALLRQIGSMRRTPHPPLGALDFVRLHHASFYADPGFMVDVLDSVYQELSGKPLVKPVEAAPRLMLLGPNLGYGDYKILELVQEAGGEIVIEEICEGMRYCWDDIESRDDPFQSLARGYLADRLPCAFMRGSAKKRFDFVLGLAKDFHVSGVLWYQMLNCETYDSESYFFSRRMGEQGMPMLLLESGYGTADAGQLKTRIETFVEMLQGGIES